MSDPEEAEPMYENYTPPEIHGRVPEEGDEVKIVYESARNGNEIEAVLTVTSVYTDRPKRDDPRHVELRGRDEKRDRDVSIWCGGAYDPEKHAGKEGFEPAQAWTRTLVSDGYGGRTWRRISLGRLVAVYFPLGEQYTIDLKGIRADEAETLMKNALAGLSKRARKYKLATDHIEIDIQHAESFDRTDAEASGDAATDANQGSRR